MAAMRRAAEAVPRRRQGYLTVGWYHSHPTFVPDPSVRDIENQSVYQVRVCTCTDRALACAQVSNSAQRRHTR